MSLVSISDASAAAVAARQLAAARSTTACRADLLPFAAVTDGDYLAFLGRISPEKRPDRAIEIARRAGIPLKIAAKVDRVDRDLFRRGDRAAPATIPLIEFVGEIGEAEKASLSRRRAGAAVPDRLARAVRSGDDRGHGLRHARDRLSLRLRAGGHRGRGSPATSSTASRGRSPRWHRVGDARSRRCPCSASNERFTSKAMAKDYLRSTEACCR